MISLKYFQRKGQHLSLYQRGPINTDHYTEWQTYDKFLVNKKRAVEISNIQRKNGPTKTSTYSAGRLTMHPSQTRTNKQQTKGKTKSKHQLTTFIHKVCAVETNHRGVIGRGTVFVLTDALGR